MQIGLGIGIPFTRSQVWLAVQEYSPSDLFQDGTQGLWLDPSDLSTMFQDSGDTTGTVPVTAVEQPVGLILDKSGRGNHAYAPSDAARPTLKQDANGMYYLLFSGAQSMQTASINFTSTDKMFMSVGVRKLSDNATSILVEFSTTYGIPGTFAAWAPEGATEARAFAFGLNGSQTTYIQVTSALSPTTKVLSCSYNIAGAARATEILPRINGAVPVLTGQGNADAGTGNYGNYPLYIGARAGSSLWFNGHLYQLVIAGKQASPTEITDTEQYVNSKTLALDWRDVTDSSSFRWNSATSSPDAS